MKVFLFLIMINLVTAGDIGVLIFDQVLTSDVIAPLEVFGMAKSKGWLPKQKVLLITVHKNKKQIVTAEGIKLQADLSIYDAMNLSVLIVPSAYDVTALQKNLDLRVFFKKQMKAVQYLASNCAGAFILADYGYLDTYQATTWIGGEKSLQQQYPKVHVQYGVGVVVDRNRVSSNGGVVSYEAAISLISKLISKSQTKEIFEALSLNRYINFKDIH
ncbi:DJ-1/PfpI family protein [bacterium]|nr:DJ-1/PfpI family protein [bacterium]